ncbi:MAG TPA: hypothetical protein VMZ02_07425 [Candidatus Limnocylindrales bacterium]|nr:hypothetical protein [Candidatus Limnocylindrales bacterium]
MTRIAVGYSGISVDQLVIWIARDAGIFAKNNLDVQAVYFSGGTISVTAMIAGDTPLIQASGPGIVSDEKKLPAKQYPSAEGIKTILDELALKEPKASAAQAERFYRCALCRGI